MLDKDIDGKFQVCAALGLLDHSGLVEWNVELEAFEPIERGVFELSWQKVDPVFGRLICWISFAAGAEFLIKGVCLTHEIEIREEHDVPAYPTGSIDEWIPRFLKNEAGKVATTDYKTLGKLMCYDTRTKTESAFVRLCKAARATSAEKDLLNAAYGLLTKSIRNRDVHAYVPNVRDSHYFLVPQLFAKTFNLLVSWLPGGPGTLNQWRAESKS
jgi:hypothetical protein